MGKLHDSAVILRVFNQVRDGSYSWTTKTEVYIITSSDPSLVGPYLPLHHGYPKTYVTRMLFGENDTTQTIYYGMLSEEHLGENLKNILEDKKTGLMSFDDLRVYQDLELVGLACLFTAGNAINKFMHRSLSSMSVTRIKKTDMPAPIQPRFTLN